MNKDTDIEDSVINDSANADQNNGPTSPEVKSLKPAKRPSRFGGLIAMVAGLLGVVASLLVALLLLRTAWSTSSNVEQAIAPARQALERMDTRIDQVDDLVDRDGLSPAELATLQARIDGLVDITNAAHGTASAVLVGPVEWLRLDRKLEGELSDYTEASLRAAALTDQVGTSMGPEVALQIAAEIDAMQSGIQDLRQEMESTIKTIKNWLRLALLVGVLLSLWSCWAQYCLLRRGLRGLAGRSW